MLSKLKKILYFPVASYFAFFAKIQLYFWKPQIIVITGSSGKTTLLHLLESQIGDKAKYSHQANSSFGIPFDILGLKRKTLQISEWPILFLLTPVNAFRKMHSKNLYIVEADCDRVGEGKFLSDLLKPKVTIWLSSSKTHSANFEKPVEENIAHEFGYFLENSSIAIINKDSKLIQKQTTRTKAEIKNIAINNLDDYKIFKEHSEFKIRGSIYKFNFLLPKETFYQIDAMLKILDYLKISLDKSFKNFYLPPGRSSIFEGIKNTTILDSTYNADFSSMKTMLNMFNSYPATIKWIVLSDMVDQGSEEQIEHEKLAEILNNMKFDKIILVGPRQIKYTLPCLKANIKVENFIETKDALNYLLKNINGRETIFFKGARFLEGIIEHLLKNKNDISKLCRREKVWQERRKKWGL